MMGRLSTFELVISHICFVRFDFVFCAVNLYQLDTVCEKKQRETIYSLGNLEVACCLAWNSHRKFEYETIRVFECQSDDSVEYLKTVR